jgi:hypothetical protein
MVDLRMFGSLLVAMFSLMISSHGFSADDISADSSTFVNLVKESEGFMIRVELNEEGMEDGSTAMARLYFGDAYIDNDSDFKSVWGDSFDVSGVKQVTEEDIESDSSTWGWFRYRRPGLYDRNFYRHRPYYYHRGDRYRYGRPYYRSYDREPCCRYRYYYYPRYY